MPSPSENSNLKRDKYLEEMKDLYERVFGTEDGKRVLEDILISGAVDRSAWSQDIAVMSANVAKQDFAKHIRDMARRVERRVEQPREAIK